MSLCTVVLLLQCAVFCPSWDPVRMVTPFFHTADRLFYICWSVILNKACSLQVCPAAVVTMIELELSLRATSHGQLLSVMHLACIVYSQCVRALRQQTYSVWYSWKGVNCNSRFRQLSVQGNTVTSACETSGRLSTHTRTPLHSRAIDSRLNSEPGS